MTTIPLLSQLPEPFSTVVMLALLIAAFYVAFKIMEMVMETLIVSVISGGFYLSLVYFFPSYSFAFDTLVFYTFAGSTLYMAYSFAVSAYGIAAKIIEIPYRIIMMILKPLVNTAKSGYRDLKEVDMTKEKDQESEEPTETKEVVLDKLNEED